MLKKLLFYVFYSMVELRNLGSVEAFFYQILVVIFLMLLLHQLSHKVNFLELPIGYYPIDLVLNEVSALLLLHYHHLAGAFLGLLPFRLLLTADVMAFSHKDLVQVEDLQLLLVDALTSVLVGILG